MSLVLGLLGRWYLVVFTITPVTGQVVLPKFAVWVKE